MNISEFKQYAKKWSKGKDPVKLLFPLEQLELLPADKKRKIFAVDHRSFVDAEGYWNVYPIAIDNYHVYIVCPWCQKVHIHGNDRGCYEGHRASHCWNDDPKLHEGDSTRCGYVMRELDESEVNP